MGGLRHARERGIALLMVLVVLMVVFLGGMALTLTTITESEISVAVDQWEIAYNVAASGIASTLSYLATLPPGAFSGTAPVDVTAAVAAYSGNALGPEGSTFTVVVDPRNGTGTAAERYYLIRSTAWVPVVNGRKVRRQLEAVVEALNFARYAYFSNAEETPTGDPMWFAPGDELYGPVHTNDQLHIAADATGPIFHGRVTSVAPTYTKLDETQPAPQLLGGFELGTEPMAMPTNTAQLETFAGAGILLEGATSLTFYVDGGGGGAAKVLIENADFAGSASCVPVAGVTALQAPQLCSWALADPWSAGSGPGAPGTANGVIAVVPGSGEISAQVRLSTHRGYPSVIWSPADPGSWDIAAMCPTGCVDVVATGVAGTPGVKGKITLAVAGDLFIDNDITYVEPIESSVLGIVTSGNVYLTDNGLFGATEQPDGMQNRYVHGVVMTLGESFQAWNWGTRGTGTLAVYGGLIQARRGILGTYESGAVVTGFAKSFVYDPRIGTSPPPYFPTTGAFEVMTLRERDAPILQLVDTF
ncbi:MAG: DUF4900 domain-containing protein [Candidatus Schekmanbacteria bacterium]|nr:DUF4900 domain-containing protein [Candidatus Schekmanbacteria bacterium]